MEHFRRYLLDALGDGPAVFGFLRNCLENQKVQGSLDEVAWFCQISDDLQYIRSMVKGP